MTTTAFTVPPGTRVWFFNRLNGVKEGPWTGEPDKAVWVDDATDLDCMILRNRSGALCGYVGVPFEHDLHGADYHDVAQQVDVHGGVTYSDLSQPSHGDDATDAICHVPDLGRPADVWWFGFSCGGTGDLAPKRSAFEEQLFQETLTFFATLYPEALDTAFPPEIYRTFEYVRGQVEHLASQLKDLG